MKFCSWKQDQIKSKLLQADSDTFNRLQKTQKKLSNKKELKRYGNYQLSQWQTNEKSTDYSSLPLLRTNKIKGQQNQVSRFQNLQFTSYLQKAYKQVSKLRSKSSLANQINISFNPQNKKSLSKQKSSKKQSFIYINETKRNKFHKKSLQDYLINGEIRIKPTQKVQETDNYQHRSNHLLKLLRQRELLRQKRYSFDIQAGITAKSFSRQL